MALENIVKATVLGIRRGQVDGNKYASIYLLEEVDDENVRGKLPLKMNCTFGLLDTVKPSELPGEYEVQVKLIPASGGKVGMEATALRRVGAPSASALKP